MDNPEFVNGSSLVLAGTTALRERVIIIDNETLVLPSHIREQMREMDSWVASGKYASEIFGIGLVKITGSTSEVAELITPRPENLFKIDGFFISSDQKQLQDILSDCQTLKLEAFGRGVLLEAEGIEGAKYGIFFDGDPNGSVRWSFVRGDLSRLFGQELPATLEEARDANSLEVGIELDGIMTLQSASITRGFLSRVDKRAQETSLKVGYTVHHHPSLALAALALEGKDMSRRQHFYTELLTYSPGDVDVMRRLGADFFEIRALGNPEQPFDPSVGITSRFYRTNSLRT